MKIKMFAAMAALTATGYFNTNAGKKVFICAEAQASDLTQVQYEALTWVEVGGVGNFGETGDNTNILNYETWGDSVVQKAKGLTDAGSPDLEVARDPDDAGQVILRTSAATNLNYAIKVEGNDKPNATGTPTIRYNRGLITGPRVPNGRNEDFDLEIFSFGLQQKQITVAPVTGA